MPGDTDTAPFPAAPTLIIFDRLPLGNTIAPDNFMKSRISIVVAASAAGLVAFLLRKATNNLEGQMMKAACLITVLAVLSVRVATADDDMPNGKFGFPLGTYLTIEGIRAEEGLVGTQTLIVDTINGKKLSHRFPFWLRESSCRKLHAAFCVAMRRES